MMLGYQQTLVCYRAMPSIRFRREAPPEDAGAEEERVLPTPTPTPELHHFNRHHKVMDHMKLTTESTELGILLTSYPFLLTCKPCISNANPPTLQPTPPSLKLVNLKPSQI